MFAFLAQAQNRNQGDLDEFLVILLAFVCVVLVIWLVVAIFFLNTLSRTLALCDPHNRLMEPAQVWLNLIPLFNLVWMFITVIRLSDTLRNEYRDRGWHRRGETYSQGLGIATCVVAVFIGSLPFLVMFIIYWVKIAGYKRDLSSPFSDDYGDEAEEYDEYDRDVQRGRRNRGDDEYDDDRPWDRR